MLVFAHRGASAFAPENTLPAFKKALEMGSTAIELDVHLSSDGIPVVIHDFYLDKTTDGTGLVRSQRWKDLSRLDAGRKFPRIPDCRIPSLEEVLSLIPPEITLNIELKSISLFKENTAETVLKMLKQEKSPRQVVISSFNHRCLHDARIRDKEIRLGILSATDMINFEEYTESTGLAPWSLHPEASYLTNEYVETAHRKGWKVYCWTVNTKEAAALVGSTGADGFFSDDPGLLNQ